MEAWPRVSRNTTTIGVVSGLASGPQVHELEVHHPKGYLEHAEEKHHDKPHLKMGSPRR